MRVTVFGGGSWGTALAVHSAKAGHETRLWVREPEIAEEIGTSHTNTPFLAGVTIPGGVEATADLARAADEAEVAIVAIPSEHCRTAYGRIHASLPPSTALVSATKGLELDTLLRMTEVATQEAPERPAVALSGPSFAKEVAGGQPTALVVAAGERALAETLQQALASRTFRVYASDDVVGVELAGALKNVIAIAAGIIDGLGYGHNTAAALITRGLAEMSRLAAALGGRPETLAGLAGLGDLVLTCTGALSRNRRVGRALGSGLSLAEAQASLEEAGAAPGGPKMVAEGIRTTLAACALAERVDVEMPIAHQMRAVLYEGKPPREAVDQLMLRSLKWE